MVTSHRHRRVLAVHQAQQAVTVRLLVARHGKVGHQQVAGRAVEQGEQLIGTIGLADHLALSIRFDHYFLADTHNWMIVSNYYAKHEGHHDGKLTCAKIALVLDRNNRQQNPLMANSPAIAADEIKAYKTNRIHRQKRPTLQVVKFLQIGP
jgi:hypothetical protein